MDCNWVVPHGFSLKESAGQITGLGYRDCGRQLRPLHSAAALLPLGFTSVSAT